MAFSFYDYDANGSIGSVDVINLIKTMPRPRMLDIQKRYEAMYLEKEMSKASQSKHEVNRIKHAFEVGIAKQMGAGDYESSLESHHHDEHCEGSESGSDTASEMDVKVQVRAKERKKLVVDTNWESGPQANSLSNKWNKFLFEIKLLRDHYFEEAVIPKAMEPDHNFFNTKRFEKFLNIIQERYSFATEVFDTPALIHFLRLRLIVEEDMNAYGSYHSQDQGYQSMALYRSSLNIDQQGLEDILKKLSSRHAPISQEFKTMASTLNTVSQCPNTVMMQAAGLNILE